jgi:hypothetical protein
VKRPLFVGSLLFCAAAAVAHAQTADEINKWFKYTPPVFEGRMPVDQAASSSSSSEKPVTTLQVQP